MNEFANLLRSLAESLGWQGVGTALVFSLLFKFKDIIYFWNENRRRTLIDLESTLKIDSLQEKTRSCLEYRLDAEAFSYATGLRIPDRSRSDVMKLLSSDKSNLAPFLLRRLSKFVVFEEQISVKISRIDRFSRWLYVVLFMLATLVSIALIFASTWQFGLSSRQVVYNIVLGVLVFGAGQVYLLESCRINTAMKLESELVEYRDLVESLENTSVDINK